MADPRLRYSPSCERNRAPIAERIAGILDMPATVVEIGAGTGQHAAYFSQQFPHLTWHPVDRTPYLESIEAWRHATGGGNFRPPARFDLFDEDPPLHTCDAVFVANVLHIAPPEATPRLFSHAARMLNEGGIVMVYGPFRYRERALEPSNAAFDSSLRHRDPKMGLRLAEEVDCHAADLGFTLQEDHPMPANNRFRWWRLLACALFASLGLTALDSTDSLPPDATAITAHSP